MLTFHHTGCVVKSLVEAVEAYRPVARSIGDVYHITSQGVKVCFVEVSPGCFIELIEPVDPDSPARLILKNRIAFYHIGLLTRDFDAAMADLIRQGYMLISTFCSEAFALRRCAFLASPVSHLIEIIEQD